IHAASANPYPPRNTPSDPSPASIPRQIDVPPDTTHSPLSAANIDTFYQTTIAQGISAGGWFVSRSLRDVQVLQALQLRLKQLLTASAP
ncbi:hypothetical protein K6U63_12270, partial [Vibrio fluvialis]|nr:hypothetical protein [Vibrio fluvialis]